MTTSATIARSGDVGRGGLNETTCLVEDCKSCRFDCQIQREKMTDEYCLKVGRSISCYSGENQGACSLS